MKHALALALLLVPIAAEATCTVTVTPIVFGRYDVFDEAPTTAAGQLVYECSSSVDRLRIRIAPSAGSSARKHGLRNGDSQLIYQLFLDPGMHRMWGDETDGTEALYVDAPSPGKSVSVPIFARIPPRQNVKVGTYSDTLTIVVDF